LLLFTVATSTATVFATDSVDNSRDVTSQRGTEICGDNGKKSDDAIDLRYTQPSNQYLTRDPGGSLPKKIDMKVTVCTQAKDNWCGAATANQVITYINGSSPSQEKIAEAFGIKNNNNGTDLATIKSYIKKQTGAVYETYSNPSEDYLFVAIPSATLGKKPPILRMKVLTKYGFPYDIKSSGHFMNASGYRDYGSEILVTDPAVKNKVSSNKTGKYYVPVKSIYDGTSNHFAKEIAF